jgi:hypothetical protein
MLNVGRKETLFQPVSSYFTSHIILSLKYCYHIAQIPIIGSDKPWHGFLWGRPWTGRYFPRPSLVPGYLCPSLSLEKLGGISPCQEVCGIIWTSMLGISYWSDGFFDGVLPGFFSYGGFWGSSLIQGFAEYIAGVVLQGGIYMKQGWHILQRGSCWISEARL